MRTARTFLTVRLRSWWLVFLRDLKQVFTPCAICGEGGAYPCSIAACIPLCEYCQREESIRLDKRLGIGAFRDAT